MSLTGKICCFSFFFAFVVGELFFNFLKVLFRINVGTSLDPDSLILHKEEHVHTLLF